jgi:predicted phosphodiesterase
MNTSAQEIGRFLEERLRKMGQSAVITYGDLVAHFNLPDLTHAWSAHPLWGIFGDLDEEDAALGRPFRTAIVVSQDKYLPGNGFFLTYTRLRDRNARFRNDEAKIAVHLRELRELAMWYGHSA